MATTLRPVSALPEGKKLTRNPIPPPPKVAWLSLDQLVIDEGYQRALSGNGQRLIRRLVERWDWNCFKPLSVAAVQDEAGNRKYEVIDGQHTAMAAATHGAIETLPCLVLDAETLSARAAAFVGINSDRVTLTPFALYRAKVAAGDDEAVAVAAALEAAGCTLLESIRYDVDYPVGTLACVSSLLQIVRRGGRPRLTRLLKLCVAADLCVIPGSVLKGLEEITAAHKDLKDEQLVGALSIGEDSLIDAAAARRQSGVAPNVNAAVMQVLLARISGD